MLELLTEMRRRKVWLFGGIYLALGWILLQVAIAVETTLSLPGWVDQIALVLLGLGFPVALLLAWAQESQGEGQSKSAAEAVSSAPTQEPGQNRPGFSVAVLPFDDLSSNGSLSENADGIAEDALTQLSYFGTLKVAARNSAFAFKGAATDIRDVGAQLNVRFVLEGSFRTIGDNVRITAQLIDAITGDHVWSRNFDTPRSELEASLDATVDALSGGVSAVILDLELKRLGTQPQDRLSADDLTSLAMYGITSPTKERLLAGEAHIKASLAKRPNHGHALALMAQIQMNLIVLEAGDEAERQKLVDTYLEKVKAAGQPEFETLISLCTTANLMGRSADVEIYAEQMREVGPKHPASWAFTGFGQSSAGNHEEALVSTRRARSLTSQRSPNHATLLAREASLLLVLGDYTEAEACARKSGVSSNNQIARIILIIAYALQDRTEEARSELADLETSLGEKLTVDGVRKQYQLLFDHPERAEPLIQALRRVGLK